MKTIRSLTFCIVMLLSAFSIAEAQTITGPPMAIINFNGGKTASANINYSSSFIIENIAMSDAEKEILINKTKKADGDYNNLQFISADNNTKLMVIIDVKAESLAGLSQKLRILFTEMNVKTVEYNKVEIPVEKFIF